MFDTKPSSASPRPYTVTWQQLKELIERVAPVLGGLVGWPLELGADGSTDCSLVGGFDH